MRPATDRPNSATDNRTATSFLRRTASSIVVLAIAAGASLLTPRSAAAQLRVCNKTSERVSIAVAYTKDDRLTSRGWFNADPSECVTVVGGPLQNRYYYVRAEGSRGNEWGDDYTFCTLQSAYEVPARGSCTGSDYRRANFFIVDTGDRTFHTQNLVYSSPVSEVRNDVRSDVRSDVQALRVTWRDAVLFPNTKALQLWNAHSYPVPVVLKCYTVDGAWKWLRTTVPGKGVAELGHLEGWDGNFVTGERCDAYDGDSVAWHVTAP